MWLLMEYVYLYFQTGFVMFYVRSPAVGGQDAIAEALTIVRQVVPSVTGIYFKDLKQTLKKEQCDVRLRNTTNFVVTMFIHLFKTYKLLSLMRKDLFKYFLEFLKHLVQNFKKVLEKYFLGTT